MMRDIQETLELWGAWAASDNSGVDFSPIAAGFKGLLPQTSKSRLQCDDDEGILVDGCIARLKKTNSEECDLIILHYVFGISKRSLGKRFKISEGRVRQKIQVSEGFIAGCLAILDSGLALL